MKNFKLHTDECVLLVIDVQDRLFSHIERSCEILFSINKIIEGAKILKLPILVSEQTPDKMGRTLLALREKLPEEEIKYLPKSSFSCVLNDETYTEIKSLKRTQIILVGIEAHVCVLQTAKDLLREGYDVVVLNDAISSRSIYDYSTAIAEMRDLGIRVSSVETILFELLSDSKKEQFKSISQLIK